MNSDRGYVGEFFLWMLGRPLVKTKKKMENGAIFLATSPVTHWKMAPTGDYFSMTVHVRYAPIFIHRWLQFLILGIRYRRNNENL